MVRAAALILYLGLSCGWRLRTSCDLGRCPTLRRPENIPFCWLPDGSTSVKIRPVETRCSNKGQGQDPETWTPNLRCALPKSSCLSMKSCPLSKARTYSQTLSTPNLGDTASQNGATFLQLGTKMPHNPLEGPTSKPLHGIRVLALFGISISDALAIPAGVVQM